jgi:hypothetical protein
MAPAKPALDTAIPFAALDEMTAVNELTGRRGFRREGGVRGWP